MRRKEDPRLITGRGRYIDDMSCPGMLYMAFVRSPEAHAKITSIDTSAAHATRPASTAVFTGEDLDIAAPLPMAWVPPGVEVKTPEHWPLAKGEVKHVGEPVAAGRRRGPVRRGRRRRGRDRRVRPAAGRRSIPRRRSRTARRSSTSEFGTNKVARVVARRRRHRGGVRRGRRDHRAADRQPPHGRRADRAARVRSPSTAPATLTSGPPRQIPHFIRLFLAVVLGITEDKVRVIAPEVGGGFGSKIKHYARGGRSPRGRRASSAAR